MIERELREVLVTLRYNGSELQQLQEALAPAELIFCDPADDAAVEKALLRVDAAIIAGDLDARHLGAPKLQWVHCDHAGIERSASRSVFERGLIVTSSAGRSARSLAQHAFWFALALTHDAGGLLEAQRGHRWRANPGYASRDSLIGKTLGIVGLGSTGREMARLGLAFGMRVIASRRRADGGMEGIDRVFASENGENSDELIASSDVVMLATSLTDETYHLVNAVQLRRMKRTSFLINVSRGAVIDEDALVDALYAEEIAGAGLDVFEREPLPPHAPIWDTPNVLISPHLTPKDPGRNQRVIAILRENAQRFRRGEPLINMLSAQDVYTHV